MNSDRVFMDSRRLCSDSCAKETKDMQNDGMYGYTMYQDLKVQCNNDDVRFPEFAYSHVNLHGRTGVGLADACAVDKYSALRNDPAQLTRDRCRIQLFSRIFQGCPNLRAGTVDPDVEMPILQGNGSDTYNGTVFACKKALTEQTTNKFPSLIECVKEVQKSEHIVEPWIRGGDDTRSFVRRKEMLGVCGGLSRPGASAAPLARPSNPRSW